MISEKIYLPLRNTALWMSCNFCFLSAFPEDAYSYNYSLKHAFCIDYANYYIDSSSSTFFYDRQKIYNYCRENASVLIRNHERKEELKRKKELEESRLNELQRQKNAERHRKWKIEYEKKKKEELQRKQEELKKKKIEDQKTIDNAEQLFR